MKTCISLIISLFLTFTGFEAKSSCHVVSAPFQENFDNPYWGTFPPHPIDSCWSRFSTTASNPGNQYDWWPRAGQTGSTFTGPLGDLTGSGQYIYTESSLGTTGDSAIIESPQIDISSLSSPQIEFFYHMYGSTMGTLELHIFDNGVWTKLWSQSGQQQTSINDPWDYISVPVSSISDTIKFRFLGIRGSMFNGDIAIDEVKVRNTPIGDLRVMNINGLQSGCELDSNESFSVELFNLGSGTADSFQIQYSINGSPFITDPNVFSGLSSLQSQTYLLNIDLNGSGSKCVDVKVLMQGDEDTLSNIYPQLCITNYDNPFIDSLRNGEVCVFGQIELSVFSQADSIFWYSDSLLTNMVHSGSTYVSNFIQSSTFYVRGTDSNGCQSAVEIVNAEVSQIPSASFFSNIGNCTVDFSSNLSANADRVLWDFGDGMGNSSQLNPTYTYAASQSYLVSLKAFDGSCEIDTSQVIFVNCITGVENEIPDNFSVYPNPASDQLTISINEKSNVLFTLVDPLGNNYKVRYIQEGENLLVDTSELASGLYVLRISIDDRTYAEKLLIER